MRRNPTPDLKHAAVQKYEEFWRRPPTKIRDFPASFRIPETVECLGTGVHVLYESTKVDPSTLKRPRGPVAYIHTHDAGVKVYVPGGDVEVPTFIGGAQALVELGQCLGFRYKDTDGTHDAEGTYPLPDLCCTVDGRALLVVQSRRKVLALIWGGGLGVEARGIVG